MTKNQTLHVGSIPEDTPPVPVELDLETYLQAMDRRLVFGHQSVGDQIIRGMNSDWRTTLGAPSQRTINVTEDTIPSTGGFIGHFFAGTNGNGFTKTLHLDNLMRGGLASEVDTCLLKFCYADIRSSSGYTPIQLFENYKTIMDDLVNDFPSVEFIFTTETIVMEADEDGPNNPLRMQYNNLVRGYYGSSGRVFDVAKALSTTPEGDRITTIVNDEVVEHLYGDYASPDMEHISGANGIGRKAAAEPLLILMASL